MSSGGRLRRKIGKSARERARVSPGGSQDDRGAGDALVWPADKCSLQHDQPEGFVHACGHWTPWCECDHPILRQRASVDFWAVDCDPIFDPHCWSECLVCGGVVRRGVEMARRFKDSGLTFDETAEGVFVNLCIACGIPAGSLLPDVAEEYLTEMTAVWNGMLAARGKPSAGVRDTPPHALGETMPSLPPADPQSQRDRLALAIHTLGFPFDGDGEPDHGALSALAAALDVTRSAVDLWWHGHAALPPGRVLPGEPSYSGPSPSPLEP